MPKTTLRGFRFVPSAFSIGCLLFACHSGSTRALLTPQGHGGAGDGSDAALDGSSEGGLLAAGTGGMGAGGMSPSGVGGTIDAGAAGGGGAADHELPDAAFMDADTNGDAAPRCGDGNTDLALSEDCDDGNRQHSDGCENDCTETRVTQIDLGWAFSCALSSSGGVKCWGQDAYGSLGRGTPGGADITHPSQVPPLDFGTTRRVTQISTGYYHACVRFEDGKARCWGRNESGQLGINSQSDYGDAPDEQLSQLADLSLSNVRSITAGRYSTCAVVGLDGFEKLYCWGSNTRGELGIESTDLLDQPGPAAELNALPQAAIVGTRWVCALLPNAARCWGHYAYGVQGVGATSSYIGDDEYPDSTSYNARGLPGAPSQITGIGQTICALSAGDLYCWGRNIGAEAGYPVATYGTAIWQTPGKVNLGDVTLVQASVAQVVGCALDDDGFVRCWGNDPDDGSLGYPGIGNIGIDRDPALDYELMGASDGGLSDAGTPGLPLGAVDLGDFDDTPGPDLASHVTVGPDRTCTIMNNGGLRCWGENDGGILGYGTEMTNIGLTDSPAQAYQQLGYADVKVFGPAPSDSD